LPISSWYALKRPVAVPVTVNGRITLPAVPDARRSLADEWKKYDA
jgi:hypothetical protein